MKAEDRKLSEEWLKVKPSSPTGYAPFLEVDGVKIAQSRVVASFLGKRFGLAGKTDLDEAKAAMIAETAEEFFIFPLYSMFEESDQEKRAAAVKKYAESIPNIMTRLEKLVGEKGYFIGDQLSYADIAFYYSSTHTAYVEGVSEPIFGKKFQVEIDWSKYPKLKAVVDHVTSNPGIAKWLKERPQTKF